MSPLWLHAERRLIAYDRNSGKQRWQSEGAFAPLSLATDGKRVYAHNGTCLKALDLMTGQEPLEVRTRSDLEGFFLLLRRLFGGA